MRALFDQSTPAVWANVVVSSIVAAALWTSASQTQIAAWLCLVVLVALARLQLTRRYQQTPVSVSSAGKWGSRFVAGSVASGALWGLAAFAFFDARSPMSQVLITFSIGGMTAGAAGTLSCYLPAFFGYCSFALTPLILRTLFAGDAMHLAMAASLCAYAAGMQRVARNNHATIVRAFGLAFENSELLARVSASQQSLEETNKTLEERVLARTAELEKQGEALRSAQRLEVVGRLAGGIAHDFNNLLSIVTANNALLAERQALDGEGRSAIESTAAAVQRGADLTRQLLAFGRRQRLEPRPFYVNELVLGLEHVLRKIAGEQVALELALCRETPCVRADPAQIEDVLVNLVINAREAMPGGGSLLLKTQQLECSPDPALADGRYVALSVEDSGVGMDSATVSHVFDPFFSTKEPSQGAGLGLATVLGIVEQSGGSVRVESELGSGSKFHVYLPSSLQLPLSAARTGGVEQPKARAATILVAEDEASLRAGLKRDLGRAGYTVLVAEDGEQALQVARAHPAPIDVLITDVVMPKIGGPELAQKLRAERPSLGVLFISGYSWGESLPPSDVASGTSYLQKPFDTTSLKAKLHELLARLPEPARVSDGDG